MKVEETSQATETEIKFQFPEGALGMLDAHPLLKRADKQSSRREVTTYYDTPDRAFRSAGASLRVRIVDNQRVQTLKLAGGEEAFSRPEWEWTVSGDQPDLSLLRNTPMEGQAKQTVCPVFTSDVTRTVRALREESGGVIEITMDTGWLRAGEHAAPVRELELELKGATHAELYKAAHSLASALPLLLGTESKAARGWRLLSCELPEAVKADAPTVPRGGTGAKAFRSVVSSLLAALMENQPAAAAGAAEGVHRMRIACRRLRTVLTLFDPHIDQEKGDRFIDDIRRLGHILGEARDWDVFCTETLITAHSELPAPFLMALRNAAEAERKAAHAKLNDEFGKPFVTHLVIDIAAWALDAAPKIAASKSLARPLDDIAPDMLDRLDRKVMKRGRRIEQRGEQELHSLRKALKRFRYALEFFAPLMKAGKLKDKLHHCKGLQNDLGAINDAAVAGTLAERLSQQNPELQAAATTLKAWTDTRRKAALGHLHAAWEDFKAAPNLSFRH
jgi:triphosphatase